MNERLAFISAFILITGLTAIIVLASNVGTFGENVRTSDFAKWGLGAVIAEVVGATVIAFKWYLSPLDISVNLDFSPLDPIEVDLDVDKCTFEIREDGKMVGKGVLAVALAEGGWQCALPSTIKPKQVLKLDFEERSGKKWEVRAFYPMAISKKPSLRGD